jgi:hypothetical protein
LQKLGACLITAKVQNHLGSSEIGKSLRKIQNIPLRMGDRAESHCSKVIRGISKKIKEKKKIKETKNSNKIKITIFFLKIHFLK